jgi:hypothetical protein
MQYKCRLLAHLRRLRHFDQLDASRPVADIQRK